MSVCAHTLVKNEAVYLWYAATSVLPFVDKMLLWDTGSTDETFEIIKEIKKAYKNKVEINTIGNVDIVQFSKVRNEMLKNTKEDWVLIVDGDEVWWDNEIRLITDTMKRSKYETIVSTYTNVIGDIYHYQDESAHHYSIDNIRGALNVRAFRTDIPGLHVDKPHGSQGYYDASGTLIQERERSGRLFIKSKAYLHFTHMNRAGKVSHEHSVPKRRQKYKHELGIPFPYDFYYPETFFRPRPIAVQSVWQKRTIGYVIKSWLLNYPRKIRRKYGNIPEAY